MASESSPPSESTPPTKVRYLVLFLTALVAVLLYLDRICLSFAERWVREDLGIGKGTMDAILGSFFLTYAIGQVPAGWLSDRFGARIMLSVYLALWSLFTGLMGLAFSALTLLLLRLGFGLFEAGGYPAAAGLIGNWIPFPRRGFASGIVSLGGRLGGFAAPLVTAFLVVAFVPVSHSSLLGKDDILNVPILLQRLDDAGDSPSDKLGRQIKGYFTPQLRDILHRARFLEALDPALDDVLARFAARIDDVLKNPENLRHAVLDPADPKLLQALVDGLNEVLGREDLMAQINVADFDLPSEALRLTAPAKVKRSPEEIQRRNRLLLETAFPESVRAVYGAGWRPVMMLYGIAGIIAAIFFWWLFRDSPRRHPACNAAEVALIDGTTRPPSVPHRRQPRPFGCLLTNRSLWFSCVVQLLTNFNWVFLITLFPRFLEEVYQVPVLERAFMASVPILVGMAGMFSGGLVTDFVTKKLGRRLGRSLPIALSRFVVSGAFMVSLFLHAPWPATIALSIVALGTDLGTPSMWAFCLDVGGKHVGTVLGWGNMFGNLGAAISPIILGWVSRTFDWNGMFLACAASAVLGGILALFIDATQPVVPADKE